jgi:hypothetical protein
MRAPGNAATVTNVMDEISGQKLGWILRSSSLLNNVVDMETIGRVLYDVLPVHVKLSADDKNPASFEPIFSLLRLRPEIRHDPWIAKFIRRYLDSKEKDALANGNRYVLRTVAEVRELMTWSRARHAWLEAAVRAARDDGVRARHFDDREDPQQVHARAGHGLADTNKHASHEADGAMFVSRRVFPARPRSERNHARHVGFNLPVD